MLERFTKLKVGDWVRTEKGRLFEIARIVDLSTMRLGGNQYGPEYISEWDGSALACAIVEARRSKLKS